MEPSSDRLLRSIAGAILGSNLRREEVRSLSERLVHDPDFCSRLSSLLLRVCFEFDDPPVSIPSESFELRHKEGFSATGVTALLMKTIQRRRYSKDRVATMFQTVNRNRKWKGDAESLSMEGLVRKFVDFSSEDEIQEALRKFGTPVSKDPFLRGIVSRNTKSK